MLPYGFFTRYLHRKKPTMTHLQPHILLLVFLLYFSSGSPCQGQTREIAALQRGLLRAPDSVSYVDRLNRIGMLMHLKSPDSCIFYGMRARKVAGRIGYPKGATDADNVIGIALALKGLNNEALHVFGRVLQQYRDRGDAANVAQVYMNFASTSMQLGRERDAVRYSRLALEAGSGIPMDSIMGKVYTNYCIANPVLPEDSVRYYLGRSNAIARQLGDQQLLIGNSQVLALFHLARGERSRALPLLTQSLERATAEQLERLEIISLNLLALYHEPDNPALSLALSERQYRLAEATGYEDLKAEVLLGMRRYAEMSGEKDKAGQISDTLVGVLLARQERMGRFVGDYVSYGKLQDDYDGLERSEQFSRKATIVLSCMSLAGLGLSLLLLRAHLATRRESRHKSAMNAVIERQNVRLRESDEFRSRLVSILAHDFRSPLISTLYLIRILKGEGELDLEVKQGFFEKLEGDISGLLGQFDTTLQWIRQQLRGESVMLESLAPGHLLQEAVDSLAVLLEARGVTVSVDMGKDCNIRADREMLQFVNRNLLSNALKFAPAGSNIAVLGHTEGDRMVVWVTDTGTGIREERRDMVFEISGAGGSTAEGAGIALALSRDFMEAMGGAIWVEATGPGGTTFAYSLPLSKSP